MELTNNIDTSAMLQILTLVLIIQISRQIEAKQVTIGKPVETAQEQESAPSETPHAPAMPGAQDEAPVATAVEVTTAEAAEPSIEHVLESAQAPATALVEHGVVEALEDVQDDAQGRTISFVEREMIRRAEAEQDRSR